MELKQGRELDGNVFSLSVVGARDLNSVARVSNVVATNEEKRTLPGSSNARGQKTLSVP